MVEISDTQIEVFGDPRETEDGLNYRAGRSFGELETVSVVLEGQADMPTTAADLWRSFRRQ
ncbi:MAG: hypothetical protein FJX77_13210 [Armatimonadetes bacterium]|nr:hypothetical protein [Armatimonadota bacterium]